MSGPAKTISYTTEELKAAAQQAPALLEGLRAKLIDAEIKRDHDRFRLEASRYCPDCGKSLGFFAGDPDDVPLCTCGEP